MKEENPEAFRRTLEEYRKEQAADTNDLPAKAGPVVRFFRWFLLVLTALILFIIFVGAPRAENPIFTVFSFALLLTIIYMIAGLANPAIIFVRRKWSRECVLWLFIFLIIVILILMAVSSML
ncbi:hypothetical protein [Paenibacillus sp. PK3_47]|uniref:hypothetical protein n=1 Tax=Paenibacillus sp. PK3_47 TaxID=2072642 RepID=UPI00201E17AD|nr:hypothetical protein [Paenibacillus sp. PK3_47]